MTYKLCKKIILSGNYEKQDMLNKLDVFFITNRLSEEEYKELTLLINAGVDQ